MFFVPPYPLTGSGLFACRNRGTPGFMYGVIPPECKLVKNNLHTYARTTRLWTMKSVSDRKFCREECGGATLPLLILFDALHMTSFYYTSDVSITNIYTIWKEVSFHL
ncbi:MAG: hypothetical protein WC295_05835, partial [Methanoregula sp.]